MPTFARRPLALMALESRDVPALTHFEWIGDEDSNANNYENYRMLDETEATRMPTFEDAIKVGIAAERPMRIYTFNRIDCDVFILDTSDVMLEDLVRTAHVYVDGALTVRGDTLASSFLQAGEMEIAGSCDFTGGKVHVTGGWYNMRHGLTAPAANTGDAYFSNGTKTYIYNEEHPIISAASFVVGMNSAGASSAADMEVSDQITFHCDSGLATAGPGVMRTGFANFIRGDDLWQGDAGWAGYGKISNYGTTHVVNTVGSDLTVDNMGVLYIKPAVFLDISADDQIAGRDVSVSSSGLIYHGNNATLQAEGWIDINGGHYILDDLDATNEFTINGWMKVGMAGNLNMWNNTDHAGTLNILKLVIDGGAFLMNAKWAGTLSHDKIVCNDITVQNGSRMSLHTTGNVPVGTVMEFSNLIAGEGFLPANVTQSGDTIWWRSIDGNDQPWKGKVTSTDPLGPPPGP